VVKEWSVFKLSRLKVILAIVALMFPLAGCVTGTAQLQVSPLTESEVRVFTDPITENILQAMNTGNYTQYTRDFDKSLKDNLPQNIFDKANSARIETVGTYVSKEHWRMSQKGDKITVAYRAEFTYEPAGVIVTVYFKNISGKWYVDGLLFYSPLMQSSDC